MKLNSINLPSKTFCRLPFSHLYADEMGQFYPCCMSVTPSSLFKTEEDLPLNINMPNVFELLEKSPQLNAVRKDFIEGKEPECCQSCFNFERAGATSSRMSANSAFPEIDSYGLIKNPKYLSIDLRLGNNCNLKCQMCHPRNAHLLEDEFRKFYSIELTSHDKHMLDWSKNKNVFLEILDQFKFGSRIHFAGGEPLLSKEAFQFLEVLVEKSMASEITLTYNTNLSIFPERYINLWKEFKEVKIHISIDGTEELNEYIRYPLKWSRFTENITKLYKVCRDFPNIQMHFHTVVQFHNIFDLEAITTFTQNFVLNNFSHRFDFITGHLHPFTIVNLPDDLKEKAIEQISQFIDSEKFKKFHGYKELKGYFELVLIELEKAPESPFKRSFYITTLFDQSRNHDFFKLKKEYSHYAPKRSTLISYAIKQFATTTWRSLTPKSFRVSLGRFVFKYLKKVY